MPYCSAQQHETGHLNLDLPYPKPKPAPDNHITHAIPNAVWPICTRLTADKCQHDIVVQDIVVQGIVIQYIVVNLSLIHISEPTRLALIS
eukprot:9509467-Alexandrium_andersonii.AAC.1